MLSLSKEAGSAVYNKKNLLNKMLEGGGGFVTKPAKE